MAKIRISLEEIIEFCNKKLQNDKSLRNFQIYGEDGIQFEYTGLPLTVPLQLRFNKFQKEKIYLDFISQIPLTSKIINVIVTFLDPKKFPNGIKLIDNQIVIYPKKIINTNNPITINDMWLNEHDVHINFSLN